MPAGQHGASLFCRIHPLGLRGISRRCSPNWAFQSFSQFWSGLRLKSNMYPSNGRLWNPSHGIVFSPAISEDNSHPGVDLLRSLHTTVPNALQTSAITDTSESDIHSEDDDAPFSTAPEHQVASDMDDPINALLAAADYTQNETQPTVEVRESSGPAEPPVTGLDFQIPPKAFHEAKSAPEGSSESFYTYTLYRRPSGDGDEQKVKVHYCRSKHTMERVCQYFLNDDVLGFDLEWYPDANRNSGPRKNVSLIQIANQSRIALFHVALFPEKNDSLVSPTFLKIMEDPNVRKVGVAIKSDCTRLRNHLAVDTRGIFELSHLYKLVKYSAEGRFELINKRLVPLATLVKEHLGLPMFKGSDVRSSDWSQPLKMEQVSYSATDAYAGYQLYHVLEGKRESLEPTPPRPHDAELNLPIRLADGVSIPTGGESTADIQQGSGATSTLPQSTAARVSMFAGVDAEDESIAESLQKIPVVAPKKFQKDPRVTAADDQVAGYRASVSSLRAAPWNIRSYYIWKDNDDLNPEAIAKILREPPLQTMTVVNYILEAIRLEELPFDKERLKNEVLGLLPKEVLQGRYKTIMQKASEPEA
nr:3'-5' exonuclease [Colletotrichum truncatum]KAF6785682.1 3'-5' exonuclease [Colletotrichum truncatum]